MDTYQYLENPYSYMFLEVIVGANPARWHEGFVVIEAPHLGGWLLTDSREEILKLEKALRGSIRLDTLIGWRVLKVKGFSKGEGEIFHSDWLSYQQRGLLEYMDAVQYAEFLSEHVLLSPSLWHFCNSLIYFEEGVIVGTQDGDESLRVRDVIASDLLDANKMRRYPVFSIELGGAQGCELIFAEKMGNVSTDDQIRASLLNEGEGEKLAEEKGMRDSVHRLGISL